MSVPLYQQILDEFKEEILSQEKPAGAKLPTEKELIESHNVSRITAKRALNELEKQGLIERIRGKGSFVKNITIEKKGLPPKPILFLLSFENMTFGNFAQGLIPYLKKKGYTVFITHADYLSTSSLKKITQDFAGLIYYPFNTEDHLDKLYELSLLDFPVVVLDRKEFGLPFPCISSDNFTGGKMATQHLIDLGHKRIAFVSLREPHHPQTTRSRYLGYINALNANHLDFHTTFKDPKSTSIDVVNLVKHEKITGIVCENDLIANQVINYLQAAGYDIPGDFSIVGFDNIQAAELCTPALTTIAQDFTRIGHEAGKMLFHWIESKQIPEDIEIPVQLVTRESTKNLEIK